MADVLLRVGSDDSPDMQPFAEGGGTLLRQFLRRRLLLSVSAGAMAATALVCLGVGTVRYAQIADRERQALLRVEGVNADLQAEVSRLRDRLGLTSQELSSTQSRLSAAAEEARIRWQQRNQAEQQLAVSEQVASTKSDRVTQLSRALEQANRSLHQAEAQRATLLARLSKAETDVKEEQARQGQAQASLDQWQKKMQQLTAEHDKAVGERDRLRARVTDLERRLASVQRAPRPLAEARPQPGASAPAHPPAAPAHAAAVAAAAPARPVAAAQPHPAPAAQPHAAPTAVAAAQPHPAPAPHHSTSAAAPAAGAAPAVAAARPGGLAEFERVLGSAGVDVALLFAQYGMRSGEGGPFIPAPRGTHAAPDSLTPEKMAALSNMIKSLPVSAPLEGYRIGSRFGVRGDPINGRSSYHTGLDMLAPYMSPVYATAAGVVTYSGYRDDYGKVVEIDHGHGLTTRYAHLHRQTVSVGQRVAAHTQIGYLGSTGRATGPHVHYEILVNGEPVDPAKFLGLSRLITVAHHR